MPVGGAASWLSYESTFDRVEDGGQPQCSGDVFNVGFNIVCAVRMLRVRCSILRRAAPRMGPTGFSLCLTQDGEVDRVMDRLS